MDEATGEAEGSGLRVAFDRRLKLEVHGAGVTSDAGLLAFRELDDALASRRWPPRRSPTPAPGATVARA
jgi:hypothetical protein